MAKPVSGIKPPSPLNLDSNISDNWKIFKQKWENYTIITELDKQEQKYQVALLQHTIGDDALRIYNSFTFETPSEQRTIKEILEKFDTYAIGEINETYERYIFNKRDQKEGESFETFLAAINSLSKTCKFCDKCINSCIRDRIVIGVKDKDTQNELLKEHNLTLETCIRICKASEQAYMQSKMLKEENINLIKPRNKNISKTKDDTLARKFPTVKQCKFCGKTHKMKKESCPAWGKICNTCKIKNHFSNMCSSQSAKVKKYRKPTVNFVSEDYDSENDYEWVNMVKIKDTKQIKCTLLVNRQKVNFQIDTGSSINILPMKYNKLPVLPTNKRLRMYNDAELKPLGIINTCVQNEKDDKIYNLQFYIVKEDLTPIIGIKTAEELKLLSINNSLIERVSNVSLIDKYQEVFDKELGCFEGLHHLQVDETKKPVIMAQRRVPLALKPKLKLALQDLENKGVITKVTEPTPWLSQLVIAPKKDNSIRVCLDPHELNKALLRERYTMPILDDKLHELRNSKFFTKADLSSAYWHVKLDEESSKLTTFQALENRYRWLRLPFGLNVSAEIFQRKVHEALSNLPGTICLADDVIIHASTEEEHDKNLEAFFSRCHKENIKLNKEKLKLKLSEVIFFGELITANGRCSDPDKVKAIMEMPAPYNTETLRRFLGMVNYLSKYIPHLTDLTLPLRNLLLKDVPWMWSDEQQQAFDKTKKKLTQAPVLAFYDPEKDLVLENDASEYGLGSALYQDGKPIAYASRTLTSAERKYAQIEKEMLAITFGLTKFHHYTYGRDVSIITDHKPLVSIVNKPLYKAPQRLQRLLLNSQLYSYNLVYKTGTSIPVADQLSRSPLNTGTERNDEVVNNLSFSPIPTERLDEIRTETSKDATLQNLKDVIINGWPQHKNKLPDCLQPYFNYRDELTIQDGIIVRSDKVVIPVSMRSEMKRKVHVGHLGINSCVRRARQLIYWPGMSAEIRAFVATCDTCATYSHRQPQESLSLHELPERPWEKVGTDIFTIHNRNYLVTVDYMSGFFEVDFLENTLSTTVITKLKHHFARHGIPDVLISDGGPQFIAEKFQMFSNSWSFQHKITSPGNSKGNGRAEAAVKVAKTMMRKAYAAREDPYLGLLNIRNTPTEGLDTSPAQRMFNRRTKTALPTLSSRLDTTQKLNSEEKERRRVLMAGKQTKYKDLPPLKIGDTVRMQPLQPHQREWKQATVCEKLPCRDYKVTADDGRKYRRNRQFLRHTHRSRDGEQDVSVPSPPKTPPTSRSEHPPSPALAQPSPPPVSPLVPQAAAAPAPSIIQAVQRPAPQETPKIALRRSERVKKKPERLNIKLCKYVN